MPWDISQVDKHYGGLDDKHKRMWVDVSNSALKKCISDGGDPKKCEISAIRQASSVVKKSLEDTNNNFYYLTELNEECIKNLENNNLTIDIDIFREGKWQHPKWGTIEGNKQLFNDFITNWESNVIGREIVLDKCHKPEDGGTGIIKNLFIDGDRLKAKVELTPWGEDLIKNKGFRYFSPEYTSKYTHKETGKVYNNVLLGGGITNRPFLTDLAPIVMSEDVEKDFKLSMTNMPISSLHPDSSYNIDSYNLICNFVDIIKNLALGGYVSVEELYNLTTDYLSRVDFANATMMSEDFKKEISNLLDEYFDKDRL